ncbi:tyrosine-type recombinase/integrase [Streptomyces sp. NRRL F-5135]|uniref:tyrosine-type recombinase/integrase n=1 Tax=Streptomyces sp. NRRL F-5135 TaxID=1463858 RepID=UPI0004C77715|nr:site-specific integrase [Streptomyces sp. NRRL F-5135]
MADPIKKITLKSGKVRYRFVVDIGSGGKRRQLTVTKDTKKEAVAEYGRIQHQKSTGTYIAPSGMTVGELVDLWLKATLPGVELATQRSYINAVAYVKTRLGDVRVQQLTEDHVDELVAWMLKSARRRGGAAGTGVSVTTVGHTLGRLRSVLTLGVRRGLVVRNVAEHTTIPREARNAARAAQQIEPWTQAEVRQFLAHASTHRLYAVMMLSLIAERPAEVCGARWKEDVSFSGEGTIAIGNTRTLVYDDTREKGQRTAVEEKETKTAAGTRTLPLPAPLYKALKSFRTLQLREKLAAGDAYEDSGYVAVDKLGRPLQTDKLRREAYALMDAAGVRRIKLYWARHTTLTWMANSGGVPDTVVSAWAGHSDLSFTKRRYVHRDPDSLKAGSEKLATFLG